MNIFHPQLIQNDVYFFLNFSNVTAVENKTLEPNGGTKDVNASKDDIVEKEAPNILIRKDEVTSCAELKENSVTNLPASLVLSQGEKITKITDATSLTKSSPSMLNKLADAIIAENFDALQNSKENISSPNLKLSKHQGSFTCFNEIKIGIDIVI